MNILYLHEISCLLPFLFFFSVSSLGQELLNCILEILDVPEVAMESVINESDFQKMLDWSEIWITLFKTTGKLPGDCLSCTNTLFK